MDKDRRPHWGRGEELRVYISRTPTPAKQEQQETNKTRRFFTVCQVDKKKGLKRKYFKATNMQSCFKIAGKDFNQKLWI